MIIYLNNLKTYWILNFKNIFLYIIFLNGFANDYIINTLFYDMIQLIIYLNEFIFDFEADLTNIICSNLIINILNSLLNS